MAFLTKNSKHALWLILLIASLLRFYGLSRGDTLTDEALYAFRAVGPMDFDEAEKQTTPLEWFDPSVNSGQAQIPWWTKFSFHDHPPLVFWIQHIFIKVFGETNFAFRFPSAILGVLSVLLLYLVGKKLYSEKAGLIAALLLAVTVNHVYISRSGLQEPYVVFFLLLSAYLFLKSLDNNRYLIWTGVALGLGFLTKYTLFALIPVFLAYLAIFKREYFFSKKLWIAAAVSFLIFSPVIIYNISLYRAVGHFDFQFSYIFGQNPEVWKIAPGKEIGTLQNRIKNFLPGLAGSNSWVFLSLFTISLIVFAWNAIRLRSGSPTSESKKSDFPHPEHAFLLLMLVFLVLLLLRIGPSFRFLSMLTPFFALTIGVFLNDRSRTSIMAALAIAVAFEIFYSVNSQIAYYPRGPKLWAYSELRYENANWGYNKLAKFLADELEGKMPALAFESRYKFIEDVQERSLRKAQEKGLKEYPALIVYDSNVQSAAQLWVLDRLHVYHGWPVIKTETYLQFLKEKGSDYFYTSGFKVQYFIIPTQKVPLKAPPKLTDLGKAFEQELIQNKVQPISIKNKRGEEAFRVYKF